MSPEVGKPRCTGTTRKGLPCKANPLKGTKLCLAHSDASVRESVGFVADNGFAGRTPLPKPIDRMREKIEERIDEILKPYFDAIDGAVVHAVYEGAVLPSAHPDLAARMAAAEKVLDRVYGKPRQATEITGADGGPVQVQPMDLKGLSRDELRQLRELMVKAGADAPQR